MTPKTRPRPLLFEGIAIGRDRDMMFQKAGPSGNGRFEDRWILGWLPGCFPPIFHEFMDFKLRALAEGRAKKGEVIWYRLPSLQRHPVHGAGPH